MACPMGFGDTSLNNGSISNGHVVDEGPAQEGVNRAALGNGVSYRDYLQLNKLLSSQTLRSENVGQKPVPDEHLFIIIHQAYELWFKQIIFDIDNVRQLLDNEIVDETKTLQIVSLLDRTVRILKLLADQMLILETMSPLDFVEFRKYLTSASGFQSLQFRLFENKLGVMGNHRVKYNAQHYRDVFKDEEREALLASEREPSLFVLIDRWLARTPGIYEDEAEGEEHDDSEEKKEEKAHKNETVVDQTEQKQPDAVVKGRVCFWSHYLKAVGKYLQDMEDDAKNPDYTKVEQAQFYAEYLKTKLSFNTITDENEYNSYLAKNERRLSHNALKGALVIYFYRDMPRFSQPYQILTFLMDIDSLLQKWRYNHFMLVQRMLGSKQGTGGSSGYLYLRTTASDRYKVFLDLFNLSTWLIPRAYIPRLTPKMFKTLSEHSSVKSHKKD